MAQTKNGEVFAFFKDIKVEKKQTVEIDLKASTEKEVLEVKLNAQEEGAEPIVQNPEPEPKVEGFTFGQNRPETIQDSVYSKIFS